MNTTNKTGKIKMIGINTSVILKYYHGLSDSSNPANLELFGVDR